MRMIHACGMIDLPCDVAFRPVSPPPPTRALRAGAPILCDAKMVANGVTRARLPAANEVICTLDDPRVAALARGWAPPARPPPWNCGATAWAAHLSPSAMRPRRCFASSRFSTRARPRPAAVIGIPVGFVGRGGIEGRARARRTRAVLVVRGRKGGSAMAAAAVNALASADE